MAINIDPQSLRALAEDIDLYNNGAKKDMASSLESINKAISDLSSSLSVKPVDIVYFGTIDARGGYSPVSVSAGHSLGVAPSKTMVSISSADSSYTTSVSVSSVSSSTVTVTVPAGYAAGGVFVLLMR